MRLLPGLLAIGVSTEAAIPEYGPARGDKCLSRGDDESQKYTMQYSIESENVIKARCAEKSDYYEMGSTQSRPCSYKSSITAMEPIYTKKGSQFRANQVPMYGPVGINSCLKPGDSPYENYSMLKNYESLSLAKKYCNMYRRCDIIVEIDRTQVANRSLVKLYEIGDTRSGNKCRPRPQRGVKISRVNSSTDQYKNSGFISNENENYYPHYPPKKRETTNFKCLQIGDELSTHATHKGCTQVFDNITTANLACSLFEQCMLIGQNRDGNFELFSESDDDSFADLEQYTISIPTMDKTQTSLIYDFTTILNHENMAITQITAYDPITDTSFVEVPKHGAIPESTHLNFYDQNLSVVIQENTCVIRHPEQTEKLTSHSAATIDYKFEKKHGNLDVDEGEYALSDLSFLRDDLPLIAQKQCYGKALIGLDFDLKQIGHETDFGAKFFFMNETESLNVEDSLQRSKRTVQKEKLDPLTGKVGTITECNGKKACGDPNFMAAVCSQKACGTLFCQFLRRGNVVSPGTDPVKGSVIEAPFVSWNHIVKQGYWCMPCCILEENMHAKMKLCSSMPEQAAICKQQNIHGRCGIEFDP